MAEVTQDRSVALLPGNAEWWWVVSRWLSGLMNNSTLRFQFVFPSTPVWCARVVPVIVPIPHCCLCRYERDVLSTETFYVDSQMLVRCAGNCPWLNAASPLLPPYGVASNVDFDSILPHLVVHVVIFPFIRLDSSHEPAAAIHSYYAVKCLLHAVCSLTLRKRQWMCSFSFTVYSR